MNYSTQQHIDTSRLEISSASFASPSLSTDKTTVEYALAIPIKSKQEFFYTTHITHMNEKTQTSREVSPPWEWDIRQFLISCAAQLVYENSDASEIKQFLEKYPLENIRSFSDEKKDFYAWAIEQLLPTEENTLLQEILKDLHNVDEEAREKQFELCSEEAKSNAEHILRKIYEDFPHRYEIYPTEDREISILADEGHGKGRAVLILCDSEGGASCFVVFGTDTRSAHYKSANKLLNSSFLIEALVELNPLPK